MSKTNKSTKCMVEEITETPFTLISETTEFKNEETNEIESTNTVYHLCVGNNEVAPHPFSSRADAVEYIHEKPWMLIAALCMVIYNKSKEYEKPLKKDVE